MNVVREIPEVMHRALFRTLSLLTPQKQGAILRGYFDWWHRKPDPWALGTDGYELHKYKTTLGLLPARPYKRILEVGCSEGVFTRELAAVYPQAEITGIDISQRALERARARNTAAKVEFLHANIVTHRPGRHFDLVFCAETLYYLGRPDRLRQASAGLGELLVPGGLLVMVHPWPEAARLHRYLDADPAVVKIDEVVDTTAHRPFSVSLYQAHQ
ncbi:class I SAM-dependent methyltransferase [Rhizohabitans arisaemae]|uniref:class I SAM-dependent methyltransferase n=1 Tax=Rhizohabitans arisaemae TaxID=2720610 RepID=UPI0024B12B4F|nr:class I SAM-dependent methyltransferase [Rhizohabitans arisaemae]